MEYNPEDIRVSGNVQDLYQRAPYLIFHRDARPNPHHLCGFLLTQISLLGGQNIQVKRVGDWYIFTADIDWMVTALPYEIEVLRQFDAIMFFPEDGVNRQRYESAIKAFAESVIIADQQQITVVSGEVAETDPVWAHINTHHPRTLAFLFPFSGTAYKSPTGEE